MTSGFPWTPLPRSHRFVPAGRLNGKALYVAENYEPAAADEIARERPQSGPKTAQLLKDTFLQAHLSDLGGG